jgi:hypothetical protein
MKQLFAVLFSLAMCACSLQASNYIRAIDEFNNRVIKGDYDAAFAGLTESNAALAATSAKEIKEVKESLESQVKSSGALLRVVKLGEAKYGEYIVQVTYAAIFKTGIMRFEFQFFRSDAEWMFLNFNCDSGLESDLRARARMLIERGVKEVAEPEKQKN